MDKGKPLNRGAFFYLVERTLTIIADAPDASTCTGLVLTSRTAYSNLVELVGGLYITPVALMRIGGDPDRAPEAIKHNADALLDDRDKLIRWQKWYSAGNKKAP